MVAKHKVKRLDRDQIKFEFKIILNSNSIRFDSCPNPSSKGLNKRRKAWKRIKKAFLLLHITSAFIRAGG